MHLHKMARVGIRNVEICAVQDIKNKTLKNS